MLPDEQFLLMEGKAVRCEQVGYYEEKSGLLSSRLRTAI
jgi:hypothetical protein